MGEAYHFEPKVSIIIPVYNGSNYLKEAIDSALAQTYKNIEVIVINDGSNDGGKTQAIINMYGKRIRGFYQPNAGVAAALNRGIDMMTGEYFSWLSHDDLYTPNKIQSQIDKLLEVGNPMAIIYSGYRVINELGEVQYVYNPANMYPLAKYSHPLFPVLRLMVNGCTVLFHKAHFARVGGFDCTLQTTQDYDMWFKLFKNQVVIYCPSMEVISRQHSCQGSIATRDYHVQECETLWLKMLNNLSQDEIDHIDDNAYAFFMNTHLLLKERTLYTKTIAYAEIEALRQMRRMLLKGKNYDGIVINNVDPFAKDIKLQYLLRNHVFLEKKKTRIAFYAYAKKAIGGLMKMLKMVAEGLSSDYEVFIFYRKDEEALYERKGNLFYIQINTDQDWEKRLAKYMVVLGIDIFIGTHNCLEYFIKMYMILKEHGIKCIAWNHEDYNFTKVNSSYYSIRESRKAVFHELDAVVWINKASKAIYDAEAENGFYIPDCIDMNENKVVTQGKEPFSLIAVGRFEDTIKRLDRVLEAFAYISRKEPQAKLYIVGGIHLDMQLAALNYQTPRQRMWQLGIALEKVIFTGWITDVSSYYTRSMIQLNTSESEGFGLIILEAANYGVPTIAFTNGGSDTIITNGKDGYIVGNVEEMAKRTLLLLENPKFYQQMSTQSKLLVQSYTKDAAISEWKKLLEKITLKKNGIVKTMIKEELKSEQLKEPPKKPLVSIIIPVYNGSDYLREAIDSALNQTYTNIEILVINDGSNDEGETREIALSYGNKIRYFEKENGGVSSALNYGIEKMKGEYFSWLSHDDRYKPNKILNQIEHISRLEDETTIIYGSYDLINEKGEIYHQVNHGKRWTKEELEKPLFPVFKGLLNGCSLLIHKSHFERVGKFDLRLKASQDTDLWFRMFRKAKLYYQSEINLETRIHPNRGSNKIDSTEEVNQGWIRRMHRVTIEEMRETMGSPQLFYKQIANTLRSMPKYQMAYEEAERLAKVYTPELEENPLISVIIPFYNRVSMVAECVASVVSQTYKNIEILVINDGSTEDTSSLTSLAQVDSRIKIIDGQHSGTAVARNRGIEEAKGTYLAFLDSDDLFTIDKIEKQLRFMMEGGYVFSHTSYKSFNMKDSHTEKFNSAEMKGIVFPQIISLCRIVASTVMIKKEALGEMRFIPGMTVSQDICLWIDIAACYELGGLDEYLTIVRVSGNTTFFDKDKVKKGNLNVLNHIFENSEYLKEEQDVGVLLSNFTLLFF